MTTQLQYFSLILVFCTIVPNFSDAQDVRINEMVLSNSSLLDEDQDTPDWFELYNPGPNPIHLAGWSITDEIDDDNRWIFPNLELPADGFLLVWASDKDRSSLQIARTHLSEMDAVRYLFPSGLLDPDWRQPGYDDSGWMNGNASLGYGDGDDLTIIPNGTVSVFLRKRFTVTQPNLANTVVLDVDYDDAFVAYLNGTEIARANITTSNPIYNSTANTDREAQLYQGGNTERYTFTDLEGLLQEGENIISIQLHNISNLSSDLSLRPWLSILYDAPVDDGIDPPEMLGFGANNLHTDFKLSSNGEVLYLYDPAGILHDSLSSEGPIPNDLSIGRLQNQPDEIRIFSEPSPAAPNPEEGFLGVLSPSIEFSQSGGPVAPLSLSLSGVDAPAQIRYTLDASLPTEDSPTYSSAIPIDENTVVRARIYQAGYLPSPVQTETYLVDVQHDLPILTLAAEPADFFDNETGIYAYGDDYSPDVPHYGANFWEDWERPIHFRLREMDGSQYDFDGGVKIFGGWSRAQDQRSLSIFARGRYGPSEIDYRLFPNQPIEEYQALVLRNSGNDWLRSNFRDAALTGLLQNSWLDVQAYRPVVTYLNGEYWGIYNMREKVNEHFLASHHGINPDDINLLEFDGQVIHGNNSSYQELIDFVTSNNMANPMNYEWVQERVDLDNMVLYQAAQIFFDNTDWPGNNVKFWNAPGQKWRWILFDTDFGFGIWNGSNYVNNTIAHALEANGPGWPNPPWSTLLFRRLMDNVDFRHKFINQLADEMNSRFLPQRVCEHIDTLAQRIAPEISGHYLRWGGQPNTHSQQINVMKEFAERRPDYVKQHVLNQFSLPSFRQLRIQNNQTDQGWVQVNSLAIHENDWTGDYFTQVPIRVTAVPASGYRFSHWEGTITSTEASLQFSLTGPTTLTPIFESTSVIPLVINEINYNSDAERPTGDWIELYNPNPFSVDVSNWQISDDDDAHEFHFAPGTIIDPEGFLLIARERADFQAVYPGLPLTPGALDFGLSSNGDQVRLFDHTGALQDSVSYSPDFPWPSLANGEGPTLELIAPTLDNTLAENWSNVNPWGSPGAPNVLSTRAEESSTSSSLNFTCYPNPSNGSINLSLDSEGGQVEIRIYNKRGQYLGTLLRRNLAGGHFEQALSLSTFPAGTYQLVLFMEQQAIAEQQWVKL